MNHERPFPFAILLYCSSLLMAWAIFPFTGRGDAVVVTKAMSASTIAEVFVENEEVRVELEIGSEDIQAFQNLLPDQLFERFQFEARENYQQRIENFFANDFVVSGDEQPLQGSVIELEAKKKIIRDEITGKPLSVQPDNGPIVIYVKLKYSFSGLPKSISLQPPRKEKDFVAANIGFITYHRGLPVMDFRYLSKRETLDLDWEDPWYSRFRNRNLLRQYDAPLSVFLYVEHFEVRVEVVVRPVDLQRWCELGLEEKDTIPVADQAELKQSVAEFLRGKISLAIDGKPANHGKLDRIHFISRTLRKTGVVYPAEDQSKTSATLGAIFVFPIEGLPEQATLTWPLFDERIQEIPAVATDETGGLPSTLTKEDPVLAWKNVLTNPTIPAMVAIAPPPSRPIINIPWASFLLGFIALVTGMRVARKSADREKRVLLISLIVFTLGVAVWLWPNPRIQVASPLVAQKTLTKNEATEVTTSLIHNLYHSFDRRDESIIFDRLATSVSGELLRDIYVQIMRRIKLEDQGGAKVKIVAIDFLETDVAFENDSPGFHSQVKWNVVGTVGHWGHVHSRANQYVADFTIEPIEEKWKIVRLQITDETNLGVQSN